MLNIRLQRVGRKNDPSFRVVVTDSKNGPQSGKFKEILGSYNARFGKPTLNGDRIKYWLSVGAKASDTVHNMLVHYKIVEGKKVNSLGSKPVVATPEVKEEAPAKVEETKVEEVAPETPAEEVAVETEAPVEETPAPVEEVKTEEAPKEEVAA